MDKPPDHTNILGPRSLSKRIAHVVNLIITSLWIIVIEWIETYSHHFAYTASARFAEEALASCRALCRSLSRANSAAFRSNQLFEIWVILTLYFTFKKMTRLVWFLKFEACVPEPHNILQNIADRSDRCVDLQISLVASEFGRLSWTPWMPRMYRMDCIREAERSTCHGRSGQRLGLLWVKWNTLWALSRWLNIPTSRQLALQSLHQCRNERSKITKRIQKDQWAKQRVPAAFWESGSTIQSYRHTVVGWGQPQAVEPLNVWATNCWTKLPGNARNRTLLSFSTEGNGPNGESAVPVLSHSEAYLTNLSIT